MKRVLAWLTALCLLVLPAMGVLAPIGTSASNDVVGVNAEGLCIDSDGHLRYYENGASVAKGLVKDGKGDVYYIVSEASGAARGMWSVPADKTNGVMPAGFYEFGADYRLIIKNGIYTNDWLGQTYYFKNSIPQAAGLVQDEDGDIFFFTNVYGVNRAVTDGDWYVSEADANGLKPAGTYHFNRYGLLTGESEKDLRPDDQKHTEIGENLYRDADGRIRYYRDGESVAIGLARDYEGNIYYLVTTNGAAVGYWAVPSDKTNGILPTGFYEFGSDRRLIVKNGIYTDDWQGKTYYFRDSIPQAEGVVPDESGHYYFFTSIYGVPCAATSQYFSGIFYVSTRQANGLIEPGYYLFGAEGYIQNRIGGIDPDREAADTETEQPTTDPEETVTEPTETETDVPPESSSDPATETATGTESPTESVSSAVQTETLSDASADRQTDGWNPDSATSSEAGDSGKTGGCGSAIGASGAAVLLLLAAGGVCLRKRK